MADIRIKDLTTLESASLTGDVFVIDGTTGTRKLSAFSPTFGGNATVTGTLTVNGTGTSEFGGLVRITAGGFRSYGSMTLGATYAGMGGGFQTSYDTPTTRIFYGDGTGFDLRFATRASSTTTDRFTFSDTGKLTISGTDASTTTSTGALVVGNGTSGGLGVGGAVVAGGTITSTASTDSGLLQLNLVNSSTGTSASSLFRFNAGTRTATLQAYNDTHATLAGQLRVGTSNGDIVLVPSGVASATFAASATTLVGTLTTSNFIKSVNTSAANDTEFTALRADVGADGTLGAAVVAIGSLPSATGASRYGFITCSDNVDWRKLYIGGRPGLAVSGGQVLIPCTTASTSTSSGALVVSGGVGVAGNTNIGGVASVGGSSNSAVGIYVINTALTGTDQYGVASEPIWTSTANLGHTIWARTKTAASAFTLTSAHAFFVEQPTLGAGSSITNIYGMRIRNQGTTGVTNAYGLYVESQSGAATVNYAIYTAGGRINFQGLPTSSAGLPAGTLWNDGGTLKVA